MLLDGNDIVRAAWHENNPQYKSKFIAAFTKLNDWSVSSITGNASAWFVAGIIAEIVRGQVALFPQAWIVRSFYESTNVGLSAGLFVGSLE